MLQRRELVVVDGIRKPGRSSWSCLPRRRDFASTLSASKNAAHLFYPFNLCVALTPPLFTPFSTDCPSSAFQPFLRRCRSMLSPSRKNPYLRIFLIVHPVRECFLRTFIRILSTNYELRVASHEYLRYEAIRALLSRSIGN